MNSSSRAKGWILPVIIPVGTGLERSTHLSHSVLSWQSSRLNSLRKDVEMSLQLRDLSLDILDVILVGLVLSDGGLLHEISNLTLSLSQVRGGDQMRVVLEESQVLLKSIDLSH